MMSPGAGDVEIPSIFATARLSFPLFRLKASESSLSFFHTPHPICEEILSAHHLHHYLPSLRPYILLLGYFNDLTGFCTQLWHLTVYSQPRSQSDLLQSTVCYYNKIPKINQFWKGFILAHSFGGFSLWSVALVPLGMWQGSTSLGAHGGWNSHLMARSQGERRHQIPHPL
jgi:hypothetical protein